MSPARVLVVASAAIPAAVLVVYSYVMIPLEAGLGLAGAYSAVSRPGFAIAAGVAWVVIITVATWRFARFGGEAPITGWRIAKRVVGAFCFTFTTGFLLAATPMGGVVDALEYQGIEVSSDAGWLGFPLGHIFLWSAPVGIVLLVVVLIELIVRRVSSSGRRFDG